MNVITKDDAQMPHKQLPALSPFHTIVLAVRNGLSTHWL